MVRITLNDSIMKRSFHRGTQEVVERNLAPKLDQSFSSVEGVIAEGGADVWIPSALWLGTK
jgi:hypothetical protein